MRLLSVWGWAERGRVQTRVHVEFEADEAEDPEALGRALVTLRDRYVVSLAGSGASSWRPDVGQLCGEVEPASGRMCRRLYRHASGLGHSDVEGAW